MHDARALRDGRPESRRRSGATCGTGGEGAEADEDHASRRPSAVATESVVVWFVSPCELRGRDRRRSPARARGSRAHRASRSRRGVIASIAATPHGQRDRGPAAEREVERRRQHDERHGRRDSLPVDARADRDPDREDDSHRGERARARSSIRSAPTAGSPHRVEVADPARRESRREAVASDHGDPGHDRVARVGLRRRGGENEHRRPPRCRTTSTRWNSRMLRPARPTMSLTARPRPRTGRAGRRGRHRASPRPSARRAPSHRRTTARAATTAGPQEVGKYPPCAAPIETTATKATTRGGKPVERRQPTGGRRLRISSAPALGASGPLVACSRCGWRVAVARQRRVAATPRSGGGCSSEPAGVVAVVRGLRTTLWARRS